MEKNKKSKELNAIRVDLGRSLTKDLEDIKRYYGMVTDTEMIRFLIREKKKEIIKKEDYELLSNKKEKS